MSNSQLNKLKSAIKNGTEVTLDLSSHLIGNSNDKTNFFHKLLLTDTQVSETRKAFANGSSANIKFSKTQLPKTVKLGGFIFAPPNISGSASPILAKTPNELASPVINLYVKELKNKGAKK